MYECGIFGQILGYDNMEITSYSCTWEHFPTANVITGGTSTLSVGSIKRKFEEQLSVNHLVHPSQKTGGATTVGFLRP